MKVKINNAVMFVKCKIHKLHEGIFHHDSKDCIEDVSNTTKGVNEAKQSDHG